MFNLLHSYKIIYEEFINQKKLQYLFLRIFNYCCYNINFNVYKCYTGKLFLSGIYCKHNNFSWQNILKNIFLQTNGTRSQRRLVFESSKRVNGKLNAKVLILNQSYEPLTVCNIKKAIILMYLGKAELVRKDERKNLRTVNRHYPWPSIIRLSRFINLPYKKVVLTRKNVLRRDAYKCAYCGRSDLPLTIDHIVPKARGGGDSWENLVCACTSCNNRKGDRTPEEANLNLMNKPFKPSHIMFIKNVVGKLDENWKPYLYLS